MSKKEGTKIRILLVHRILERHPEGITVDQIMDILLKRYDISCSKKSIYSDLYNIEILYPMERKKRGYQTYYRIISLEGIGRHNEIH